MSAVLTVPAWLQATYERHEKNTPDWLIEFRENQWDAFRKNGLPTSKDEAWKYADLSFLTNNYFSKPQPIISQDLQDSINQHRLQQSDSILLVSINGYFMPALSDLRKLPQQVIACNVQQALQKHTALIKPYWSKIRDTKRYPFASLNAAMCTDGLFFYLPDHCQLTAPIHFLSLVVDENEFIAHPRHVFLLGEQSKLQVVEEQFAFSDKTYMINSVTTISVAKQAQFEHYKIQNESPRAVHLAHFFVQQMQESSTAFTNFSFGSLFARDELVVTLQEPGADCRTAGFYHTRHANQYIDNHIEVNHAAARTKSEMLYKGILENKSRAVFNGRLHVEKDAQKIWAYQANHNMLLSKDADVYSKPELEIYADDVKCKHGASVGQLDQDALFYLRSRGIEKSQAITMLLQGFADGILQRINHAGIKMRVQEVL